MTSSTLILFQIRFSDSSGRGGIVVYGGEEPGSSPTAEPKQEPPTASAEGPAVPLGPIDGMPMPSVDVVEEEKDESLNTARRLFPDVELPDKPEKPCSAELQVEPPRMRSIFVSDSQYTLFTNRMTNSTEETGNSFGNLIAIDAIQLCRVRHLRASTEMEWHPGGNVQSLFNLRTGRFPTCRTDAQA
eukprot:7051842-Pyramimonas_sp.AAC.2